MGARALSTLCDLTKGGRSLEAIQLSTSLTAHEKLVLLVLASKLDVGGDFREWRWMFSAELAKRTSLSRSTVFRVLAGLVSKGYLLRSQRRGKFAPKLEATAFCLTGKIFDDYAALLTADEDREKFVHPSQPDTTPSQSDTTPSPTLRRIHDPVKTSSTTSLKSGRFLNRPSPTPPGARYEALPMSDSRHGPRHAPGCKAIEAWDIEACDCGAAGTATTAETGL